MVNVPDWVRALAKVAAPKVVRCASNDRNEASSDPRRKLENSVAEIAESSACCAREEG